MLSLRICGALPPCPSTTQDDFDFTPILKSPVLASSLVTPGLDSDSTVLVGRWVGPPDVTSPADTQSAVSSHPTLPHPPLFSGGESKRDDRHIPTLQDHSLTVKS